MYNQKFSEFKEKFLNDPKVKSLMLELSNEFEKVFKEDIIDTWTQEEEDDENIEESIETIYSLSRDDMDPEDFTIFEILLFSNYSF
jgi:hypothetical protein